MDTTQIKCLNGKCCNGVCKKTLDSCDICGIHIETNVALKDLSLQIEEEEDPEEFNESTILLNKHPSEPQRYSYLPERVKDNIKYEPSEKKKLEETKPSRFSFLCFLPFSKPPTDITSSPESLDSTTISLNSCRFCDPSNYAKCSLSFDGDNLFHHFKSDNPPKVTVCEDGHCKDVVKDYLDKISKCGFIPYKLVLIGELYMYLQTDSCKELVRSRKFRGVAMDKIRELREMLCPLCFKKELDIFEDFEKKYGGLVTSVLSRMPL